MNEVSGIVKGKKLCPVDTSKFPRWSFSYFSTAVIRRREFVEEIVYLQFQRIRDHDHHG